MLVVRDEGAGITAAELPHIFAAFYRTSDVAHTTAGNGIGLFGARALVERQGGTPRLVSTVGRRAGLTGFCEGQ